MKRVSFDWPDEDPPEAPKQQERGSGCWPLFSLLALAGGALLAAGAELVQALA